MADGGHEILCAGKIVFLQHGQQFLYFLLLRQPLLSGLTDNQSLPS